MSWRLYWASEQYKAWLARMQGGMHGQTRVGCHVDLVRLKLVQHQTGQMSGSMITHNVWLGCKPKSAGWCCRTRCSTSAA